LVIFVVAGVLLVAFVAAERRAPEPVLPLWVVSRRILAGGNLAGLVVGALMIGLTSYLPAYAQGVLGVGPVVAGFAVAALTIGWPLAASQSGRLYLRIGFRDTALVGSVFVVAGAVLAAALTDHSPIWTAAAAAFVLGVGLGLSASPTVVAIQSVVGWDRRGVVTGAVMFSRSLGSAVGAAVFGAIANATLARRFADPPSGLAGQLPADADAGRLILDASSDPSRSPASEYVRRSLFVATHHVFVGLVVLAVLIVAAILLMPRRTSEA
jgi:MFS family permease